MNWKRGFFRLWVFATALWFAFAGALAVLDNMALRDWHRDAATLSMIIGAPVLVLVLGAMIAWIAHGFRGENPTANDRTIVQVLLVLAVVATTITVAAVIYETGNSYDDCILKNMRGVPNDAVGLIRAACLNASH